ncbi:unnamed protein product, partial [Discosporangium mesarthrocarpum]
MFVRLYQRTAESYEAALSDYHGRLESREQPSTPFINLFDVDVEEGLLVGSNFLFLTLVVLVYMRMLGRKAPVRMRGIMLVYNMFNVCLSLYVAGSLLAYKISVQAWDADTEELTVSMPAFLAGPSARRWGGFVCNPMRTDPAGHAVASVFVVFYLQKYLELFDTFFFILRRSFKQARAASLLCGAGLGLGLGCGRVTFLHLFHHCSITVIVGSVLPFDFNGDMYLPIMLNSIVHVLVYLHYVFTAMGWESFWGPYLAGLQMTQFAVIFFQSAVAFYEGPDCGSPDFVKVILLLYMGSMLGLFGFFFGRRYLGLGKGEDMGMCGVIKSPEPPPGEAGPGLSWHGNTLLDKSGKAVVLMPSGFREVCLHCVLYYYGHPPSGA